MNLLQRHVKKGIAVLLSAALLLPAWTGIASAEEKEAGDKTSGPSVNAQVYGYADTANHWSHAAVGKWSEYGVVQGYGDGTFKPDQAVTRAEFASLLQNISRYVETSANTFSDVSSSDWFFEAVTKLKAAGIMEGSDGKAHPGSNITRQEAAVLLARAFQLKDTGSSVAFTDKTDVAAWASAAVGELATRSVLKGFPDGSFKPQATLTRAEATALFDQFLAKLFSKSDTYTGDIKGNVVVNAAGVTLQNMTINGDLYIAQGVGEGEVHLDGVTINGTVYVQGGGEHSILFNNVNVKGSLVVNKYNGKVRVVASGNTNVSLTMLENGAMLVTRDLGGGGFESVIIAANALAGQQIVLDGTFNKVTNRSAAASIKANGTIKELVADAATKLTGEVKVEKVSGKDSAAVTINDKSLATSTTGGGGGGGFGGGGGGGSTTINVSGVALKETNISLQIGETKQLTAEVTPSNATNKAVTWRIKDGSSNVISVDDTGMVTAKSPGVKEIVVRTQNGNYEAKATVTVKKSAEEEKLGVKVTLLTSENKDPNAEVDGVLIENGRRMEISGTIPSSLQPNEYSASVKASQPLAPLSVGQAVYAAYAVIQLTDSLGVPLADTSGVTVTVNGAVYNPHFGEGISEKFKPGSFLYLLDTGNQEGVTPLSRIDVAKPGYTPAQVQLNYMPAKFVFSAEGVFDELEKFYLGANPDKDHILGNMLLWGRLESYPLVSILWSSSNPDVINTGGYVKRMETEQTVTLTATLSGKYTGSKTYNVIVRDNKIRVTRSSFTDSYFAEGFPKAYMKNGTVHLELALKRPGEIYSVMTPYDNTTTSTVDSVLKGYGGLQDGNGSFVMPIYDWPYVEVGEQMVGIARDIDTKFQIGSFSNQMKMDFVIKDGNHVSDQVTSVQVELEQPVLGYATTYEPGTSGVSYKNQEQNAIYIYFNRRLDLNYMPTVNDFTVDGGQVTGVTVYNDDLYTDPEAAGAYVKLSVTMNTSNMPYARVYYTGKTLRDMVTGTPVQPFENEISSSSFKLDATVSSDRRLIKLGLQPGWRWTDNATALILTPISQRVSVKMNGQLYPATIKEASNDRYIQLEFSNPLPEGTPEISYSTAGMINWARESYPAELHAQALQIPAPGIPTASYQNGVLNLTFAQGFTGNILPYMFASGLVLEADGIEYELRGHIISTKHPSPPDYNTNAMDINLNHYWSQKFKQAVDHASTVRIKYKKVLPKAYSIYGVSDSLGAPVPDFDYINVIKSE